MTKFLLTVLEEDRKDWPKLKKAILTEYWTNPASSEQAFISRMHLIVCLIVCLTVCLTVLLYRDAFGIEEGTALRRPKQRLLASFFEEFLSPYLQNCNQIAQKRHNTQTWPNRPIILKTFWLVSSLLLSRSIKVGSFG